jgi:mono/diheme cytochrome c family protein
MHARRLTLTLLVPMLATAVTLAGTIVRTATLDASQAAPPARPAAAFARTIPEKSLVERGAYLVQTMGCNDCHTPLKMGPRGPEPDMSRALTGHPQELVMPAPPALPAGPWMTTVSATNTAWAGPWGVSFTANLTPDKETGLGNWTFEMFYQTMKTGRHLGKGRPILPPMPYFMIGAAHDDEIRAIFAYLQSLKPVHNKVPAPIDPPGAGK